MDLPTLKRRRGAIQACITRPTTKIADLENRDPDPSISTQEQLFCNRLETLDSDYKTQRFVVIYVIEDEEQLAVEQETLDKHADEVSEFNLRLQALMASVTPSPPPTPSGSTDASNPSILERCSAQLQVRLTSTHEKIQHLREDGSEVHLICLYQEHLADLKRELSDLRNEIQ